MSSPLFRRTILEAFATRLESCFLRSNGSVGQWARAVTRGPLRPQPDMRPCVAVVDGGQRRLDSEDGEDESGAERVLTVLVVLQLAANWHDLDAANDWSDRVEQVIDALARRLPAAGVLKVDYVDDDPVDVVWTGGETCAAWEIRFEVRYVVDSAQA